MNFDFLKRFCDSFSRVNTDDSWYSDSIDYNLCRCLLLVTKIKKPIEEITNKDFENYFKEQIAEYQDANYHHKQLFNTDPDQFIKEFLAYHVSNEMSCYNSNLEFLESIIAECRQKKAVMSKYFNYLKERYPDEKIGAYSYYSFDAEKLKPLFLDSFLDGKYDDGTKSYGSAKRTCFQVFCDRLDIILTGKDEEMLPTKKLIGSIARMLYYSPFTTISAKKKDLDTGKRYCFKKVLKLFFDAIDKSCPKDDHKNTYNPNDYIIDYFKDLLQYDEDLY